MMFRNMRGLLPQPPQPAPASVPRDGPEDGDAAVQAVNRVAQLRWRLAKSEVLRRRHLHAAPDAAPRGKWAPCRGLGRHGRPRVRTSTSRCCTGTIRSRPESKKCLNLLPQEGRITLDSIKMTTYSLATNDYRSLIYLQSQISQWKKII